MIAVTSRGQMYSNWIDFPDLSYIQIDTLRAPSVNGEVRWAATRLVTSCWPLVMSPLQPLDADIEGHNDAHSKQTVTKLMLKILSFKYSCLWYFSPSIFFSFFLCSRSCCHFVTKPPLHTHHHHLLLPHVHTQLLAFNVQMYFCQLQRQIQHQLYLE